MYQIIDKLVAVLQPLFPLPCDLVLPYHSIVAMLLLVLFVADTFYSILNSCGEYLASYHGAETCGLDVFLLDDLCSRPEALCLYNYIYIYAFLYEFF